MLSFNEITQNDTDFGLCQLKFDCFSEMVLVVDRYCVKPFCTCAHVLLEFWSMKGKRIEDPLFGIQLDITSWQVSEERYNTREKEAKQMDDIFPFVYRGTQYAVFEQYCLNPACKCNEVLLGFIKIQPERKFQEAEFVVRLNLNDYQYSIEEHRCSKNIVHEITAFFLDQQKPELGLLKKHYDDMKRAGKEILATGGKSAGQPVRKAPAVGRNDPCPCGSGKKYKKCCLVYL